MVLKNGKSYTTFHEILMLLRKKMVKPVQDYARRFRIKMGRRRLRGAAWSVSNCASVSVELIPIIRKRITTRCTLRRLRVFHFIRPIHQTRVIRPQKSHTSLTLLPKPSSFIFSSSLSSRYSPFHLRHRHCYMPPVIHFHGTCSPRRTYPTCVTTSTALYVECRYNARIRSPKCRVKKMHHPKLENWRIILLGKSRGNRRS